MTIHDETAEVFNLAKPFRQPRNARVIDRASKQAVFEQDITGYSEADRQEWFITVARMFDIPVRCEVEWPKDLEGNDL